MIRTLAAVAVALCLIPAAARAQAISQAISPVAQSPAGSPAIGGTIVGIKAGLNIKKMIVCVLKVHLQEIVVHVLGGKLGSNAGNLHRFQLKHDQSARGILREGLIYFDSNFFSRLQFAC